MEYNIAREQEIQPDFLEGKQSIRRIPIWSRKWRNILWFSPGREKSIPSGRRWRKHERFPERSKLLSGRAVTQFPNRFFWMSGIRIGAGSRRPGKLWSSAEENPSTIGRSAPSMDGGHGARIFRRDALSEVFGRTGNAENGHPFRNRASTASPESADIRRKR